ncbi:hypothetical protein FZEAL_1210 [Fusarium zealandicum]|uniref:Thioredoxin domain-containing protein n=1 Tax=Fusarium zealandicum TaxID=1053134 RepID=A0A8H4UTN5_9HYPO|nr:hypothetical protein FZEAL_1210 [Fusarium zealandicum]
MSVTDIKTKAEFEELIKKTPYVVLQAHATWCGPCKAISPIFNKQADVLTIPDKYAFAKFDTDDVPDLAFDLGIRSIPAFFFFANGEKNDTIAGANPPVLTKALNEFAEKAKEGGELKTDENF